MEEDTGSCERRVASKESIKKKRLLKIKWRRKNERVFHDISLFLRADNGRLIFVRMFFKEKIPLQDSEWNDYFDRHIDSRGDFFTDGF